MNIRWRSFFNYKIAIDEDAVKGITLKSLIAGGDLKWF
jgi:hypothetical protein